MDVQKIIKYGKKYKVYNGIYYSEETSDKMIQTLDRIKANQTRVQFRWGNPRTGTDWGEVNDVEGRIGTSTGEVKIPLLIHSRRSLGGGGILTGNIVKIMESKGKKVIYQHKKYHLKEQLKEEAKAWN